MNGYYSWPNSNFYQAHILGTTYSNLIAINLRASSKNWYLVRIGPKPVVKKNHWTF